MNNLLYFFDEYTLKARFLPACIAGLPLLVLIASYFDWNEFLISNVIAGVLVSFIMVFLLSNFARYMGKNVEKKSIKEWEGFPTTQLLRHQDNIFNQEKKIKIHELLTTKSFIKLPSLQDEISNSSKADNLYNEAITWLKVQTRDEKSLLNENIIYGFIRNSLGLKLIAILICIISLIILMILFFINYEGSLSDFNQLIIFFKGIKMALWLTIAVSLLMPLYWILAINEKNLRRAAINYAKTLINLVYKV